MPGAICGVAMGASARLGDHLAHSHAGRVTGDQDIGTLTHARRQDAVVRLIAGPVGGAWPGDAVALRHPVLTEVGILLVRRDVDVARAKGTCRTFGGGEDSVIARDARAAVWCRAASQRDCPHEEDSREQLRGKQDARRTEEEVAWRAAESRRRIRVSQPPEERFGRRASQQRLQADQIELWQRASDEHGEAHEEDSHADIQNRQQHEDIVRIDGTGVANGEREERQRPEQQQQIGAPARRTQGVWNWLPGATPQRHRDRRENRQGEPDHAGVDEAEDHRGQPVEGGREISVERRRAKDRLIDRTHRQAERGEDLRVEYFRRAKICQVDRDIEAVAGDLEEDGGQEEERASDEGQRRLPPANRAPGHDRANDGQGEHRGHHRVELDQQRDQRDVWDEPVAPPTCGSLEEEDQRRDNQRRQDRLLPDEGRHVDGIASGGVEQPRDGRHQCPEVAAREEVERDDARDVGERRQRASCRRAGARRAGGYRCRAVG